MTKKAEEKLKRYVEIIITGKPEPPTQLEKDAWETCGDFLDGKPPKMDLEEAHKIMDAYLAKPHMTAQQWLDLEKEVNQFLEEEVDLTDPLYRPHAHTIGVLHRMCEAARFIQQQGEETSGG